MERYVNAIRHADVECCSNVEDHALAKQERTMTDDIMFRSRDIDKVEVPTIDSMENFFIIGHALMRNILIDSGSSINIIYKKVYGQILLEAKDLKPCKTHIHCCDWSGTLCRAAKGVG